MHIKYITLTLTLTSSLSFGMEPQEKSCLEHLRTSPTFVSFLPKEIVSQLEQIIVGQIFLLIDADKEYDQIIKEIKGLEAQALYSDYFKGPKLADRIIYALGKKFMPKKKPFAEICKALDTVGEKRWLHELRPQQIKLLSHAQSLTDWEIVKGLIEQGINVNSLHPTLGTPLIMAIFLSAKFPIIQFLIEKGADIDAVDADGLTPLITAVKWMNLEVVEFLLNRGANPFVKTSIKRAEFPSGSPRIIPGRTALQLAQEQQRKEPSELGQKIIALLKKALESVKPIV